MWEVGKATRPFRYDLNEIPIIYTVEVKNRFSGLDLVDKVTKEIWMEVCNTVEKAMIKRIPKKRQCKKAKWLSKEAFLTLRPHGLKPTRLHCPWGSPGNNPGVCCHFLFQGIFPTQGPNLHLLLGRWILYHRTAREAHLPYVQSLFPVGEISNHTGIPRFPWNPGWVGTEHMGPAP